MAKTYKIYTAGKMSGLTFAEQMDWRVRIEKLIREKSDKLITFIHPPMFYTYGEQLHKNETEVMEWDISQLKDSDIVIVDLTTISDSIGTHIELGVAKAMNEFGYKHIHIVGVGKANTDYPWIPLCLLRQEESLDEAANYIARYLLV